MSTGNDPLATRSPPRPVPGARLTTALLPIRVRRQLTQLQAALAEELGRELEHLLDLLEADLFRQAERARNTLLQTDGLENLRTLRENRIHVVPRFLDGLDAALAGIREPARDTFAEPPLSFNSLCLVDDTEVSEESVLQAIALRHESRAGLQLMLLGQRFGVLAGAPAFDAANLPVGPESLARLLAMAADVLQVNLATRLQLFRLFDRHLMANYNALVESMNLLLDHGNVLPGLTFVPLRQRAKPRREAETEVPAAPTVPAQGVAAHAAPGSLAAPEGAGGRPTEAGQRAPGGGGSRGRAPAPSVFTGWPGEASARAPQGEQEDLERLQALLVERRQLLDRLSGAMPERPHIALATAEVDAALSALQTQRDAQQARRTPLQIRQELLAGSHRERSEVTALSHQDSETFELLGLLYTEIGRELREDGPGSDLLDRLQVPLLRVALQDRTFFVHQQHPARQLLGAVAESGAAWHDMQDADPQFDQRLRDAVDHVVTHYTGDAAVFESANESLQLHLQRLARKADASERRHVEAARGREKLDLAKQRAGTALREAIGDRKPPRFLQTLLDQAWTDVSTLMLLRHGEGSEPWRDHADATAGIIAAGIDGVAAPEGLEERVREALGLVGYQGEEAAHVARRLTSVADDNEDGASRTELVMRLKARARLGEDGASKPRPEPAPRNPHEQELYEHLRTLPFGSWLEFVINQQGDVVRHRLAWYSLTTGRILFVNARGQRTETPNCPHDLDHVSRLLANGQARIVTADSARLIDRAWNATLGVLRGLTGRDAARSAPSPDASGDQPRWETPA